MLTECEYFNYEIVTILAKHHTCDVMINLIVDAVLHVYDISSFNCQNLKNIEKIGAFLGSTSSKGKLVNFE